MKKYTLIYLGCLLISANNAHAGFFDERMHGWHWYEDATPPAKEEPKPAEIRPTAIETPSDRVQRFKKLVQERLDAALDHPTYQNVKAFKQINEELMSKSQRFADMFMKVTYTSPELDYTVKNPKAQGARHIYHQEQSRITEQSIAALAKTHGLFFVFRSDCPYCHGFAPIVKRFAEKYQWTVVAISMDGKGLPEFPHVRPDTGITSKLGITVTPALLAVNPYTEEIIPLSYGMIAEDEIEQRVRTLFKEDSDETVAQN